MKEAPTEATLLLSMIQPDHEAVSAPQFNIVAVYQLLCPDNGIAVSCACERTGGGNMAIIAEYVHAVLVHLGGCNPGDEIHSAMRAEVSACLARRIRSSRLIPGSIPRASSRRRFA
jgi:hypothetical protein